MKDQSSQNSTSQSPRKSQLQSQLQSKQRLAQNYARKWFRKVWDVRGGGLYAVGYILTFLFFEAKTLIDEIAESTGLGDFLSDQLLGFLLRFIVGSFENMIKAFMWPVYIIQINPIYGGIALGLAFVIFPKYLKKPLERQLFGEDRKQT